MRSPNSFACALLLALAVPAAAQLTCPDYYFASGCAPQVQRSVAADSVECSEAGGKYCRVAYDFRRGYFAFDEFGLGMSLLQDSDSMRIVGPLPGTPVTFRLHLRAQCAVDANPSVSTAGFDLNIQMGSTATEGLEEAALVVPGGPAVAFDREQDALVHEVAGKTFPLYTFWRGGSQNSRAWMRSTLEILDLPPGSTLLSCRGFGTDLTPVRRRSWGGLRQHYR